MHGTNCNSAQFTGNHKHTFYLARINPFALESLTMYPVVLYWGTRLCGTYALNPNYMRVTGSDWSSRPDKSFFIPRSTRSKYRTCNEAPAETTNGFIVARKTSDPYPKLCATLRVLSLRHHHPPIIIIAIVIAIASFIQHLTLLCLPAKPCLSSSQH